MTFSYVSTVISTYHAILYYKWMLKKLWPLARCFANIQYKLYRGPQDGVNLSFFNRNHDWSNPKIILLAHNAASMDNGHKWNLACKTASCNGNCSVLCTLYLAYSVICTLLYKRIEWSRSIFHSKTKIQLQMNSYDDTRLHQRHLCRRHPQILDSRWELARVFSSLTFPKIKLSWQFISANTLHLHST